MKTQATVPITVSHHQVRRCVVDRMTSTNEDASAKSGRPIYLTPDNTALTLSEADAAIGAGENSRICISGFRDSSLTFLENFQNSVLLKELVITNCENIEVPNLAIFTQLTSLVLQDTKRKRVVDLSHLKYLEKMSGEWGKGWINTDCLLSLCDVGCDERCVFTAY